MNSPMEREEKQIWELADVIDLEYFLHQYAKEKEGYVGQPGLPEREIYLNHIEPALTKMPDGPERRKAILRRWLHLKQRAAKTENSPPFSGIILPGQGFRRIFTGALFLLSTAGFLSGSALAAVLLFYTGKAPVNVSVYIGLVILLQLFLLLLLAMAGILRRVTRFSLISRMFSPFFLKWMNGIGNGERRLLSAERAGGLRAIAALLEGKRRIYGPLFFWPFFILTQTFQLFFNIGLFLTTGVRVLGTDLAFGWQSTLQISAEGLFKLVSLMALPWAWIVPAEMAHPTLSQIEGSRIILKEGIRHMATSDMVSWWPFLLLGVFFYGILPRCILLITGVNAGRVAIRALKFDTYECDRLLARLTTPVITEGRKVPETERVAFPSSMASLWEKEKGDRPGGGLIVILPSELFSSLDRDSLDRRLFEATGRKSMALIPSDLDFSVDSASFPAPERDPSPWVVILQEAWQPPIRETLSYYREIRRFYGPGTPLMILLVGKPEPGNIFTPVEDTPYGIWKQVVGGLFDPYTHVERIVA